MTLPSLIERVEKASGPIDGVTAAGWLNDYGPLSTESAEWELAVKALQGSLDAALALVDRVLPGRDVDLEIREIMTDGKVHRVTDAIIYPAPYSGQTKQTRAYGMSPPLALLAALLRALQSKES